MACGNQDGMCTYEPVDTIPSRRIRRSTAANLSACALQQRVRNVVHFSGSFENDTRWRGWRNGETNLNYEVVDGGASAVCDVLDVRAVPVAVQQREVNFLHGIVFGSNLNLYLNNTTVVDDRGGMSVYADAEISLYLYCTCTVPV